MVQTTPNAKPAWPSPIIITDSLPHHQCFLIGQNTDATKESDGHCRNGPSRATVPPCHRATVSAALATTTRPQIKAIPQKEWVNCTAFGGGSGVILLSAQAQPKSPPFLSPLCELLLNWFHARGDIANRSVEEMNNKAKLTIKEAYGFQSYYHPATAGYHQLGKLPKPQSHHRFC